MTIINNHLLIGQRLLGNHREQEQVKHQIIEVLPEILAYFKLDYINYTRARIDRSDNQSIRWR